MSHDAGTSTPNASTSWGCPLRVSQRRSRWRNIPSCTPHRASTPAARTPTQRVFSVARALPVAVSATLAFEEWALLPASCRASLSAATPTPGSRRTVPTMPCFQSLRTDNLVISGRETGPIRLTPSSVRTGQVPGGHSYTVSNYVDQHGCLIGQRVLVHGMGHYWSGGSSNPKWADFTDPKGPSAATASWLFLSLHPGQHTPVLPLPISAPCPGGCA